MRQRAKPTRLGLNGNPPGRRVTIRSGEIANSDIAAKIARQVNSMSPAQIDAYIVDHGLTHLADPERLEAILKLAISDDGDETDEGDKEADSEPSIPGYGLGEATAFDRIERNADAPGESRRKAH